ncbi:MAG: hypothetical protein RXN87_04715 [Acidilobus sp.]
MMVVRTTRTRPAVSHQSRKNGLRAVRARPEKYGRGRRVCLADLPAPDEPEAF